MTRAQQRTHSLIKWSSSQVRVGSDRIKCTDIASGDARFWCFLRHASAHARLCDTDMRAHEWNDLARRLCDGGGGAMELISHYLIDSFVAVELI